MTATTHADATSLAVVLSKSSASILPDDVHALAAAYLAHALAHVEETAPPHPSSRSLRHGFLPGWTRNRMAAAHRLMIRAGLFRFSPDTPRRVTVLVPPEPPTPDGPQNAPTKLLAGWCPTDFVTLRVRLGHDDQPDTRRLRADLEALGTVGPNVGVRLDVGAATWPHPFIVYDLVTAYRAGLIPWPSIASRREDVRRAWRDALERAR